MNLYNLRQMGLSLPVCAMGSDQTNPEAPWPYLVGPDSIL